MGDSMVLLWFFCTFLINSSLNQLVSGDEFAPIVTLPHGGKIRGKIHQVGDDKVYLYQGIRYGRAERFAKPVPVTSWPEEVYDATKDGNSCHQFLITDLDMDSFYPTNKSEDCLFLNVWKPISEDDKLRPVMVWIYGGGFQSGTIFTPFYEGIRLTAYGDLIVVSINYRLGVLGFSFLGIEGAPGNQGFHDQILGLKWVQENIKSFGGDPNQVTLFGESAGSISISTLVLSPMAKGLFQRVILQSGAVIPTVKFFREEAFGKMMTEKLAENIGCHQKDIKEKLECMKSVPIEEIKKVAMINVGDMICGEMIGPLIGDEVFPEDVARMERQFNEVDVIFGITRNEGSMFIVSVLPELGDDHHQFTMDQVKQMMKHLMNRHFVYETDIIIEHYTKNLDVSNINEVRNAFSQMYGDFRLACPTILFGEELSRRSSSKHFYSYRFDRVNPYLGPMMLCKSWMDVCHAMDVPYTFGLSLLKEMPEDYKLSEDVIKAWTQFAKTGHPGDMGQTKWLEVFEDSKNPTSSRTMILDIEYKMVDNLFKDTCHKIWEPIMANWHPNYAHHKIHKNEL